MAQQHRRFTTQQWADLIKEQQAYGVSIDVFCTRNRLGVSTFVDADADADADADNGEVEFGDIYWGPIITRKRGATDALYLAPIRVR